MGNKNRPSRVIIIWFLWLLACLTLITLGVLVFAKITVNDSFSLWQWLMIGSLLVVMGLFLGYFGTIRFFWNLVAWIAKNDLKAKSGKGIRGPKIVLIGGGTGLGTILRGLKEITPNLTAIVTVADDGGSSGRLRREFDMLPPGDIRNCLVAMADIEPLMESLMQYRFTGESALAGHNFGNLFLAAMTDITGDFEEAIKQSGKVLAVRGQVLPATLSHVILKAELMDGTIVTGESEISKTKVPIQKIRLEPEDCKPLPEAIIAINEADLIILGPGSLYTSIIPNLLVSEVAAAIKSSTALKIYICNAMTQPGETDAHTASDHVRAILLHGGKGLMDLALVNTDPIPAEILERYAEEGAEPVVVDLDKIRSMGITPIEAEIIVKSNLIRHDADKLAQILNNIVRTHKIDRVFFKVFTKQLFKMFKKLSGVFLSKLS